MSNVAMEHGTHLAIKAVPVAQRDSWSFHLPLHWFAATCLREIARGPTYASTLIDRLLKDQVNGGGRLCIRNLTQKLMLKNNNDNDRNEVVERLF